MIDDVDKTLEKLLELELPHGDVVKFFNENLEMFSQTAMQVMGAHPVPTKGLTSPQKKSNGTGLTRGYSTTGNGSGG